MTKLKTSITNEEHDVHLEVEAELPLSTSEEEVKGLVNAIVAFERELIAAREKPTKTTTSGNSIIVIDPEGAVSASGVDEEVLATIEASLRSFTDGKS